MYYKVWDSSVLRRSESKGIGTPVGKTRKMGRAWVLASPVGVWVNSGDERRFGVGAFVLQCCGACGIYTVVEKGGKVGLICSGV